MASCSSEIFVNCSSSQLKYGKATFFFLRNSCNFFNYYLFIFSCVGSSFLCKGFLQLRQVGATLHRGARASHHRGLCCCRAQAPDAQAQQVWPTGPSCSAACGILPEQGPNPSPPALASRRSTTAPPGKPRQGYF